MCVSLQHPQFFVPADRTDLGNIEPALRQVVVVDCDQERRNYSALILAALIMGHHLSISDCWKVRSASGVCCSSGNISCERLMSFSRVAGLANAFTSASLSLTMMSLGVPFGTQIACQKEK